MVVVVGDFASVFHSDNPDLPCLDSDDLNVSLPEKCSTKRLFWDCDLCILTLEDMIHSLLGAVSLSTIGPNGWLFPFFWARICPYFQLRLRRPSIEYSTYYTSSPISLIFHSTSTSPPLHPTAKSQGINTATIDSSPAMDLSHLDLWLILGSPRGRLRSALHRACRADDKITVLTLESYVRPEKELPRRFWWIWKIDVTELC